MLNTESPIFACLPGVETVPIQFTPTYPGGSGTGNDVGGSGRNGAGVKLDRSGVGGGGAVGGGQEGGEDPSGRPGAAWIEKYDGALFQSSATGDSAAIPRTFASLCGR